MTNQIALVLGLCVLGAIAADVLVFGSEYSVFIGRKLVDLIEWLSFWR